MFDEDVCPACESSNTKVLDTREDWDYKYVDMECEDCGCRYTCQFVEVLSKIEIMEDEDEN